MRTDHPRVMRRALIALGAAAALLPGAAAARTEAGTLSVHARFYSDYLRITAMYQVYDASGACSTDEYGFYENDSCYDYDNNSADLDVRISNARTHRRVYADAMYGFSGKSTDSVFYSLDLGFPYYCSRPITRSYIATVRLFDPISDAPVASRSFRFQ